MFFEEQQNEWAAGRGKKYRNVLERDSHETIGNSDVTVSHIYICHTREFEFGAPSKVPSGRMLITERNVINRNMHGNSAPHIGTILEDSSESSESAPPRIVLARSGNPIYVLPGEIPLLIDTFGG